MTMTIAIIAAAVVLAGLVFLLRGRGSESDEALSEADRSLLDASSDSPELDGPLLELKQADGSLIKASLSEDIVPVGRVAMDATPGCSIVIDASTISRKHAQFERRGDEIWLTDLESANGSWVNGEKVTSSTQVFRGDHIRFDEIELTLKTGEPRPRKANDTAKFTTPPATAENDFGATAIMDQAKLTPDTVAPDNTASGDAQNDGLDATQIWQETPANPASDTVAGQAEPAAPTFDNTTNATMIMEQSPLAAETSDDDATMLLQDENDPALSIGPDDRQRQAAKLSPSFAAQANGTEAQATEDDDRTVVELPPSIAERQNKS